MAKNKQNIPVANILWGGTGSFESWYIFFLAKLHLVTHLIEIQNRQSLLLVFGVILCTYLDLFKPGGLLTYIIHFEVRIGQNVYIQDTDTEKQKFEIWMISWSIFVIW